ncbi:MAG: hypothetical protein Kow006_02660 [Gammaproteobacteria bacterium]
MEIIVVDDGSTDNTADLLDPYKGRIEYIRQRNRGVNAARNRGLEVARGERIALLDSDDVWLPFKTELQMKALDLYPDAGFVFSNFYIWSDKERTPDGLGTWEVDGKDMSLSFIESTPGVNLGLEAGRLDWHVSVCDIYSLSLYRPVVLPSTAIFKRSLLATLPGFPEDNWMCGDWEFFARASRIAPCLYLSCETTLNRSHDDGVRLMRKDLGDRTRLRLESLRRLWKDDEQFMKVNANEVLGVEAKEIVILLKEACNQNQRDEALEHLRYLRDSLHQPVFKWYFWYLISGIPMLRNFILALRG